MKKYEKPEIEITMFEGSNIWMQASDGMRDDSDENPKDMVDSITVDGKIEPSNQVDNVNQDLGDSPSITENPELLGNIPGNGQESSTPANGNADTGVSDMVQESSDSVAAPPAEETSTGDTTVTETPADQL